MYLLRSIYGYRFSAKSSSNSNPKHRGTDEEKLFCIQWEKTFVRIQKQSFCVLELHINAEKMPKRGKTFSEFGCDIFN